MPVINEWKRHTGISKFAVKFPLKVKKQDLAQILYQ
jgi:hypothetical protein